MISPVLRFDADELMSALDAVDPVDLIIGELVGRPGRDSAGGPEPEGRLRPWPGGPAGAEELVLLEDPRAGRSCVLPGPALRGLRAAVLTALAGRLFVPAGVVTAAVLGSDTAAQLSLTLVARYLPGLSHVAVCPSAGSPGGPLQPRVVDQLDLAGVGWSVTAAAGEAVFGANLVVAAEARRWPEVAKLPRGAVLVNTTGEDPPDRVLGMVDQVYVDDVTLLGTALYRRFTRPRRAGPRIEADFAQVLTGAHSGRTHVDHVLLVELLGADELDAALAGLLHRAALEHGLGVRLVE